jgi:hypothetical protein
MVAGGYFAALLLAAGLVFVYATLTDSPVRQASSGMSAFGDALLFLACFGAAAVIPTALGLFFLRQARAFWTALSMISLAVAATNLVAGLVIVINPGAGAPSAVQVAASLAVLRLFASVFLGPFFFLSSLISPEKRFRNYLLCATACEGLGCLFAFGHWFVPMLVR